MTSPIVTIALTLAAYELASNLYTRTRNPLLNPIIVSALLIIGVLHLVHMSYGQYMGGGQYIGFLMGPATVALAVPLYRNLELIRKSALPIAIGLVAGSLTGILSVIAIANLLHLPEVIVRSLEAKGVTTAVGMSISQEIGGMPGLTAAFAVANGVLGVLVAMLIFRTRGNWRARGLGLGVAAHGMGTSHALSVSEVAGAFSGLGMGLNAVLSALVLPLLALLLH